MLCSTHKIKKPLKLEQLQNGGVNLTEYFTDAVTNTIPQYNYKYHFNNFSKFSNDAT